MPNSSENNLQYNTPEERIYLGLLDKGRTLAGKKKIDESISIFKQAIKLCPSDALPQFYLGVCFHSSGDQYMAMHHYLEAIKLDSSFVEAYINLGKLYVDFEPDAKKAIHYFEEALRRTRNAHLKDKLYAELIKLKALLSEDEQNDYEWKRMLNSFSSN